MPTRETAVSQTVEYETKPCVHCDREVVVDDVDVETEDATGSILALGDAVQTDEFDIKQGPSLPRDQINSNRTSVATVMGGKISIRAVCDECSNRIYNHPHDTHVAVHNTHFDVGAVNRWTHREAIFIGVAIYFAGFFSVVLMLLLGV
ncbi:hypothetical protein GOC83_09930 [Haloarcula rubripromontorii]|uniref:Uncharacterized protein n=1 Tax=Haloarcula rubripromontorii TaxID=1705562 RepID=A0A847U127_9EURY|nr:hypothetical protein [Haloarcula rubripromontorii]NLV06446.1 hypothetical protein [Haloarcula rubripromontorii]